MKMKTRSKSSLGKQSLPGDRQGASRTDAGCGNTRVINGVRLNRRVNFGISETLQSNTPAAKPQNTGGHRATRSNNTREETQPLVSRVSEVTNVNVLGTTKARHRWCQRKRWTTVMNEFVMRTYYKLMRLKTNRTAFRVDTRAVRGMFPRVKHYRKKTS